MRIFITGGAGFIGTHLCKKLFEQNHVVTVYDDFSNSSQKIFHSTIHNEINLISGDIMDFSKLNHSMMDHDVVIHLAAKISVSDSIKNPQKTFDVNVCGTYNVLESCRKNNISKIIAMSSSAVYQNSSENIILDETSPVQPLSPYGASKLDMEKIILDFNFKHNIDAIILRLFNVYGIGQSFEYAGVITKFISDIKNSNPLTIFGDGYQTRDFVNVSDVVDSIILSLHSNDISGIFNIGSGRSITILDLANLIIKISRKNSKINFLKPLTGELYFSNASILKAKNILNFSPHVDIYDGIKNIIFS